MITDHGLKVVRNYKYTFHHVNSVLFSDRMTESIDKVNERDEM